jgi:hypothetical protein
MPRKQRSSTASARRPVGEIAFITERQLDPGEFSEHFRLPNVFTRPVEEVRKDWGVVLGQVSTLATEADTAVAGKALRLDSLTVELAFNAKGQLLFIAEAGVQASVSVTFKRSQ